MFCKHTDMDYPNMSNFLWTFWSWRCLTKRVLQLHSRFNLTLFKPGSPCRIAIDVRYTPVNFNVTYDCLPCISATRWTILSACDAGTLYREKSPFVRNLEESTFYWCSIIPSPIERCFDVLQSNMFMVSIIQIMVTFAKNIAIFNVTFGECSRVVGFAFRRARGVLRQWDVEALCHKVKPQLPHICKWSLRDGMLESVGKWKPISATTSQLDWDGLAFLSGGPGSGTSTDIQPVKESTDPLVQLHHEWPLGVIPSKLSEGGTLSLLYNCSCSSYIECFKAVCRLTDHC